MEQIQTKTQHKTFGISGTQIKLLALGLMLLDHIHYFFEFTGNIPLVFSMAGRISGWLFLFTVVEGFTHTSNRKKYILRIWLMSAAMGVINYCIMLFLPRSDGFYPQNNIFATLTVLLVMWQGIDWLKKKKILLGLIALIGPVILTISLGNLPQTILPWAYLLEQTVFPLPLLTEGGVPYLLGGLVLYLFKKNRILQVSLWAVAMLAWNLYVGIAFGLPFGMQWITYHYEWMGVLAAIPMLMYNGEKGIGLKKLFYIFYPAHVYILWALSFVLFLMM